MWIQWLFIVVVANHEINEMYMGETSEKSGAMKLAVNENSGVSGSAVDENNGVKGSDKNIGVSGSVMGEKGSVSGSAMDENNGVRGSAVDGYYGVSGSIIDENSGVRGSATDENSGGSGSAVDGNNLVSGSALDENSAVSGSAKDENIGASGSPADAKDDDYEQNSGEVVSKQDHNNLGNVMSRNITQECSIEHCSRCENTTVDEFCEKCSAIKDPTQRQACEMCRSGEKEVSVDDTTDVDWRCEQCEPEYAASEDRRTCISCKDNIQNCSECSSNKGQIVCSLCDDGFFIDNDTICEACRNVFDNCESCRFLDENVTSSLTCTACELGYFFNYYGNCSACNESIPHCTNCSSLDVCRVFGPVRNLTCHNCEEDYYVGEDQASCKLDCRNVSQFCENCSLADGICFNCSAGSYLEFNSISNGTCQDCRQTISNCTDCTSDLETDETLCSQCHEGFTLSIDNRRCDACNVVKHCEKCVSSADSSIRCTECHVGFSLSHNKCHECNNVVAECSKCESSNDECTACIPGFTLREGKCQRIACGIPPPPPVRGGYAFTGMYYGDTVTYDCECGYDLHGTQTITCGSDGQWLQPPCCRRQLYGVTTTTRDFDWDNLIDGNIRENLKDSLDSDVRVISLQYNQLTDLSWITEFIQLDTLKELNVGSNRIQSFSWDDIPPLTEVINLSYNKLVSLPHLSRHNTCVRVKTLHLYRNQLENIKSEHIPHTVVTLDLGNNKLTTLCNLTHTQITGLYLSNNQLSTVRADLLPPRLWYIDLRNNPVNCKTLRHSLSMRVYC